MGLPCVAIGVLGGTITMEDSGGGLRPTLTSSELVASVPALAGLAQVEAVSLASKPGASLTHDDLLNALVWARASVDAGAAGVVLVQGTDTLEESAYLLDLFWDRSAPLIVTGAMRAPGQLGADGPANLFGAVAVAVDGGSRERGVLVVMNDAIHAAERATKRDSLAVDAFRSGALGQLGSIVETQPMYDSLAVRRPPLPSPAADATTPRVALVTSCLGDSGDLIELIAAADYDGLVIAAMGAGHVPGVVADAVHAAAQRFPVVVATRTGSGPTASATYSFTGSESDLLARGAILAGWVPPLKARLLLWATLTLRFDLDDIRSQFILRGPSGRRRDYPAEWPPSAPTLRRPSA